MLELLKQTLLADKTRLRRFPFGIARGLRMNINFRQGQTRLFLGLYETELTPHLRDLCRPGYKSFDVGGQFAYDALLIAKLTHAEVVTLECDSDLVREMRQNIKSNPAVGNLVQIREAFVAARTDPACNHVSLDDVATDTFIPDFIKMDIEGGEAAALEGFSSVLRSRKPSLIVEVHSRDLEEQCMALLKEYGYTPQIVGQRRWLGDYRPTEHNRWLVAQGREPSRDH